MLKLSSWPHEKAEKSALKHVQIVIAGSNPALKNLKSSFVCQLHGLIGNLLEICAIYLFPYHVQFFWQFFACQTLAKLDKYLQIFANLD